MKRPLRFLTFYREPRLAIKYEVNRLVNLTLKLSMDKCQRKKSNFQNVMRKLHKSQVKTQVKDFDLQERKTRTAVEALTVSQSQFADNENIEFLNFIFKHHIFHIYMTLCSALDSHVIHHNLC